MSSMVDSIATPSIDRCASPAALSATARHRRGHSPRSTSRLVVVTMLYAGLMASLTLGPESWASALLELCENVIRFVAIAMPFASIFGEIDAEFVANVALFIPFGTLVARWLCSWNLFASLAIGFVLSAAIELAQLAIPGRVTDPRDLVANTAGAAIGVALIALTRAVTRTSGSQ